MATILLFKIAFSHFVPWIAILALFMLQLIGSCSLRKGAASLVCVSKLGLADER